MIPAHDILGACILVVDDQDANVRLLTRLLSEVGDEARDAFVARFRRNRGDGRGRAFRIAARNYDRGAPSRQRVISFSMNGILTWALLVLVISIVASLFPALRAVRLTATQVLAYE